MSQCRPFIKSWAAWGCASRVILLLSLFVLFFSLFFSLFFFLFLYLFFSLFPSLPPSHRILPNIPSRYWNEVGKGSYIFDRAQREAAKVKGLTKEDVVRFLDECVGRGGEGGKEGGKKGGWEGGRKMVVVVHGSSHPVPSVPAQETAAGGGLLGGAVAAEEVGRGEGNGGDKTKTTEEETRKSKKHVWVTDPSAFKRGRALYPLRPQVAVEVVGVAEPCSATATE